MASAGPVLTIARSADVFTVLTKVELLLFPLGSNVLVATCAMSVTVERLGSLAGMWSTRVNVWLLPAGSGPPDGGPLSWMNDTRVALPGRMSVVLTPWASDGPALVVL